MTLRTRPARLVAAVGAVLAAGTTTFMALSAGTASADEPGRCTQNVNVRKDPDPHARIVALCERGKQVKIGDERGGFVHLEELGGWASKDYVKADDTASSEHDGDADEHHSSDDASDHDNDGDHNSDHDGDHDGDHNDASPDDTGHGDSGHDEAASASRSSAGTGGEAGLGGLLS